MTPTVIIALVMALVQGLPEIEAAIASVSKMIAGTPLTDADKMALGAAFEEAHRRVQAA